MKKIILAVSFVVVLFTNTHAQAVRKSGLFFDAGLALPAAPTNFIDYWNMGFNFGAGTEISVSNNLAIVFDLAYHNYPLDEEAILKKLSLSGSGTTIEGGSATFFTALLDGKYYFRDNPLISSPYLIGGIGYFGLEFEEVIARYGNQSKTASGSSQSDLGVEIGIGADFPLSPEHNFFLQLKYGIGFTEGETTQYIPFQIGFRSSVF